MRRRGPSLHALDAVLFDVGGTLLRLDYEFIARRSSARGAALAPTELHLAEAAARREIDRRARHAGGVEESDAERIGSYFAWLLLLAGVEERLAQALAGELEDRHAEENLWRVPIEGAETTLLRLRERGLRTAAVSNADGRVEELLRQHGLRPHLDVVLDSHLEGVEKPDPEIFHRALMRLGVAAERAAYVGDIYSIDAVGARAAGLAPVILDATDRYRDHDCPTIARLAELLDWA